MNFLMLRGGAGGKDSARDARFVSFLLKSRERGLSQGMGVSEGCGITAGKTIDPRWNAAPKRCPLFTLFINYDDDYEI
jgi:hypothetical protein